MTEEPRRLSRGATVLLARRRRRPDRRRGRGICQGVRRWQRGRTAAADCAGALVAAKRVEPLAKGEVAAFRVATARTASPTSPSRRRTAPTRRSPHSPARRCSSISGRPGACPAGPRCRRSTGCRRRSAATSSQVVAVNVDLSNEARARAFLDEIGVKNLAFYSDPTTAVFRDLKRRGLAFGLPTTLLVDGKGCRIGVVEGPAAWDSEDARTLIGAAMASG